MVTRKARAIAALLGAKNAVEAASTANVSERTIRRWMADPGFRGELLAAEGRAIDSTVRRLVRMATIALDAIDDVLTDDTVAVGIRLRAAGMVLDHLVNLRQLRDVEQRLVALETAMANFERE